MKSYLLIFFMFSGVILFAQQIHPKIQEQIDSMQVWMQHELETTGTVSQEGIDKWNAKIDAIKMQIQEDNKQTVRPEIVGDGEIRKYSGVAGSSWVVPKNEIWKVTSMTVIDGLGGYEIAVKSVGLPKIYHPGERLQNPSFVAEAALLTQDQSTVTFKYTVMVTNAK